MRTLSVGLAATLFLAASGHAQDTPADWIRKLGSGSYVERERAAKLLEQKGKTALPLLREASVNAARETRRRAPLLMERIEDRALVDDLVKATPTLLQFHDVEFNDAPARNCLRCRSVVRNAALSIDTGEHAGAWASSARTPKSKKTTLAPQQS